MRFTVFIEQNVPWFDVTVQNAVLMRVVHSARHFHNEFHRAPDRHRLALDCFVKLAAFDKLHAEVALPITLADLVNGNNAWMLQAGRGFRFPAKTLQVRFGGPGAKADHFERYSAIEALLVRAINYALTATANLLQQFVIAKVCKRLRICDDSCNSSLMIIRVIRVWQIKTSL